MNNILSNLIFPQKTEPHVVVPPNTILIDTSSHNNYINLDYINKRVYNNFVEDYSKFSKKEDLTINITSFSGDIFYILLIANIINKHQGHVTAKITKYCMGGALFIALSCDSIIMDSAACIGPMNFYTTYIPIDFIYNALINLNTYNFIPSQIKENITSVNLNLLDKRKEIESYMHRLFKRQYSHETIDKIIESLYINPLSDSQIFKEDVPSYLNIQFDNDNDTGSLDSSNGEDLD